jgi:hypothetical protein
MFEWAAGYADEGMAEGALDLLRGAVKAGYPRPSVVLSDTRFRALRRASVRASVRRILEEGVRESSITMVDPDEAGEALVVEGVVRDAAGEPVAGAVVYVFHTDRTGVYSEGGMDEDNPRLFGYMKTDAQGRFRYRTIRPGLYPDQDEPVESHVHCTVTAGGFKDKQARLGFRDDPFWKRHNREAPAWTMPVSRGPDGVAVCEHTIVLTRLP